LAKTQSSQAATPSIVARVSVGQDVTLVGVVRLPSCVDAPRSAASVLRCMKQIRPSTLNVARQASEVENRLVRVIRMSRRRPPRRRRSLLPRRYASLALYSLLAVSAAACGSHAASKPAGSSASPTSQPAAPDQTKDEVIHHPLGELPPPDAEARACVVNASGRTTTAGSSTVRSSTVDTSIEHATSSCWIGCEHGPTRPSAPSIGLTCENSRCECEVRRTLRQIDEDHFQFHVDSYTFDDKDPCRGSLETLLRSKCAR
jgi:hypothetical protein